ncbi:hypothetical protein B0H21DRAFT_715040 [Amylocystis lapponica]|nr:hypothetical protein B0H21DRAFT_715040 [Amylocystis lapponica]
MQALTSCARTCWRCGTSSTARWISSRPAVYPRDFDLFIDFLSTTEQRILLTAALHKLDSTGSRDFRRRRRGFRPNQDVSSMQDSSRSIESLFLPDEYYEFEEGHYDGVIKRFREMHVTSWPEDVPGLPAVLKRLRTLHPHQETQIHLLHLASDGEILPHVDNLGASGSWIMGVSLGAGRILRLEGTLGQEKPIEIFLPSGSVYLQRDSVRYGYKHSILRNGVIDGVQHTGGQRLSMMIRDRLPVSSQT